MITTNKEQASWLANFISGMLTGWGVPASLAKALAGAIVGGAIGAAVAAGCLVTSSCTSTVTRTQADGSGWSVSSTLSVPVDSLLEATAAEHSATNATATATTEK